MENKTPRDAASGILGKLRPGRRHPTNTPGVLTPCELFMPQDELEEATRSIDVAGTSFDKYSGNNHRCAKKAEHKYDSISENASAVCGVASPLLSPALQDVINTEPVKEISTKISAIVDGIPALLALLDTVAEIHPFIGLAVGVFRVAVELDLKRRENDKKVALLFAAMRDMMAVLTQLKGISGHKRAGDGDITISERMERLIKNAAEDIKNCANACNAYAKTFVMTKVLLSGSWSTDFKKYMERFLTRRDDFLLALSIYTGQAINAANDKLDAVNGKLELANGTLELANGKIDTANKTLHATHTSVELVSHKMDRILSYLETSMTLEESELTEFVKNHGGPEEVMANKTVLRQLFDSHPSSSGTISVLGCRDVGGVDEFQSLQAELRRGVEGTIAENLVQFQKEFESRQYELAKAVHSAMRNECDRIINAVTATYGPYNKINDPDIQGIWKQMRWRGSVNGQEFVRALRDHLRAKFQGPEGSRHQDEWTWAPINAVRPQAIIEAFGDEAASTGRISVENVNAFIATPRPDKWSLLHWLAYWAVGHQMITTRYAEEIDVLLAKMFALKRDVLPANRNGVYEYLHHVWTKITALTAALRRSPVTGDKRLFNRFKAYTQARQDRLIDKLEQARYTIDDEGTLIDICGPGPIEKELFPLLCLLLKRDFVIVQLARRECLHVDELRDSMRTILSIFTAVDQRYAYLADSFKHHWQGPDYVRQLKIFSFDMFKFKDDHAEISKLQFQNISYNPTDEAGPAVDAASVVRYPLQIMDDLFTAQSFEETEADRDADGVVRKILGHWTGFCGEGNIYPSRSMISLNLHASPSDRTRFQATGTALNGTYWHLTGQYTVFEEHEAHYMFTITYTDHSKPQCFSAELDEGETTLSGIWGYRHKPFPFIFKRIPSNLMCFYPTPTELVINKPQALWRFAISAVRDQVSRQRASCWWLQKRWEIGQRYSRLVMRRDSGLETSRLTLEEVVELARCQRSMTSEEARLFNIFIAHCDRSVPIHFEIQCRACKEEGPIRGCRILCITCGMEDPVNLCDKVQCLTKPVYHNRAFPHRPSHDILKLRTAIHPIREYREIYRAAQSASDKLRQIFADLPSRGGRKSSKQLPQCVVCQGSVKTLPCWYCVECEGDIYICVPCEAKYGGITAGDHQVGHAIVQCQYLQSPMDVDSEHTKGDYSCMNERRQPIDEFLHHPWRAAGALGSKAAASLQGCVPG